MLLTNRHSVVRYVAAETRARNGQLGSSHQRTKQRRDAVDFQDVLNGRVYTIAVKQKNRPAKVIKGINNGLMRINLKLCHLFWYLWHLIKT